MVRYFRLEMRRWVRHFAAMQQTRRTLSLKSAETAASADPTAELIAQAIRRNMGVSAVYNRVTMHFAPQILYTRHGDPFVDAVVTLKDGRIPRELKLGSFKLMGLSQVALIPDHPAIAPLFDGDDARYQGTILARLAL